MEYHLCKCVLGLWTEKTAVPVLGYWYENSDWNKAGKNVTSHNANNLNIEFNLKPNSKFFSLNFLQFQFCKLKHFLKKTPFQKFTIKCLHWTANRLWNIKINMNENYRPDPKDIFHKPLN